MWPCGKSAICLDIRNPMLANRLYGLHAFKERKYLIPWLLSASTMGPMVSFDPGDMFHILSDRFHPSSVASVYGEVALWGDVIEHERGFRAQYAYPRRLWVAHWTRALNNPHDCTSLSADIRRNYGCETYDEYEFPFRYRKAHSKRIFGITLSWGGKNDHR